MVCNRCIKVVRDELQHHGYDVQEVKLGEAILTGNVDRGGRQRLKEILEENGFEVIDDKKAATIEKMKNTIIELIHHHDQPVHLNFSHLIEEKVGLDYNYLSSLFSSLENMTVERYIILQRIEKVKELLVYNELTLSEIAWQTGYSSVQHLSNQFKKITGFTPSYFKQIKNDKRRALDKVK